MEFDWDDAKHERNIRERGFGFDYAALIFLGPVLERMDNRRDYGEARFQAIGDTGSDILFVVYTLREGAVRILSARPANRKERLAWRERQSKKYSPTDQ